MNSCRKGWLAPKVRLSNSPGSCSHSKPNRRTLRWCSQHPSVTSVSFGTLFRNGLVLVESPPWAVSVDCHFEPQISPTRTFALFGEHPRATSSFVHQRLPGGCICRRKTLASRLPNPVLPSLTTGRGHPAKNTSQLFSRGHLFPESQPAQPDLCKAQPMPIWPFVHMGDLVRAHLYRKDVSAFS